MKQKRGLKELIKSNLLNFGLMILIIVSIPLINAGNVIVKEGKLSIDNDLSVNINNLFVNTSLVRVGIGTSLPTQLLDVRGNINVSNELYVLNGTAVSPWLYNQTQSPYFYNMTQSAYFYNMSDGVRGINNGTYPWFRYLNVSGEIVTGLINISGAGGRVGIGTASPATLLDISTATGGEIRLIQLSDASQSASTIKTIGWKSTAGTVFDYAKITAGYGAGYANSFMTFNVADSGTTLRERIRIDVSGNVGIGTTAPTHTLDVIGTMNVTGISVFDSKVGIGTSSAPAYLLQVANSPIGANLSGVLYVNGTSGKVGIGDTSPISLLTVGNGDLFQVSSTGAMSNTVNTTTSTAIHGKATGTSSVGVEGETTGAGAYNFGVAGFAIGTGTTNYGIYGQASGAESNWAGYFDGQVYVTQNVSAQGFIDRSRWCNINESNAISALMNIQGKTDGSIDKDTMPSCAVVQIKTLDEQTNKTIIEKGRDIGAYISYLTIVNQEQQKENTKLKNCIVSSKTFEELRVCVK